VASYYYRLYASQTRWKSGKNSRSSIVAMDYVRNGVPKSSVQGAHQKKKRATRVKGDLKAFCPQLLAKDAKSKEAVDRGRVAAVALQPAQRGG
jgi:hypothetical protein